MEWREQLAVGIAILLAGALLNATVKLTRTVADLRTDMKLMDRDVSGLIGLVQTVTRLDVRVEGVEKDVDQLAQQQRRHQEHHPPPARWSRDET